MSGTRLHSVDDDIKESVFSDFEMDQEGITRIWND